MNTQPTRDFLMVNGKIVHGKPPAHLLKPLNQLVDEFHAKGGQVTQVPTRAADGVPPYHVQRIKPVVKVEQTEAPGKSTRSKGPLTQEDAAKYATYLNALPKPVQAVVQAQGLDPREVYKEYRALKKEGLIKKYCPAN